MWRLYGWALCQWTLQYAAGRPLGVYWDKHPWIWHGVTLAGLALLLGGPRLPAIVAAALLTVGFVGRVTYGDPQGVGSILDEYLLYATLPVAGAVIGVVGLARGRGGAVVERHVLAVFRVAAVSSLGFAALAKLNADFFHAETTCAALGERLHARWSVSIPLPGPVGIFALEALSPLLLLVFPRAGLAVTVFLLSGLAHIGPTAFAAMLLAASCAVFPEKDGRVLRRAIRRRWWLPVAIAIGTIVVSQRGYQGRGFVVYASYQIGAVGMAWAVGEAWIAHLRRHGLAALRPRSPARGVEGTRVTVWVTTLAAVLNGMTPYLGIKYRYSFAMLSNLRVDHARWNSLVVPRWVYLYDEDPFVRVLVSDGPRPPVGTNVRRSWLVPGLYAPGEFARRLQVMRRSYVPLDLEIEYLGRKSLHPDALKDLALLRWAKSLPPGRLFQRELRLRGRQPCVH